jgi:hypothetical protein
MSTEDVKGPAEEAVESAQEAVKKFDPKGLVAVVSEVGTGMLALTVSITAAVIASQKFRAAYTNRSQAVKS